MVKGEGSRPLRDHYQIYFSNDLYFSFMLGLVGFIDIAKLCNRPNNCCQQNLKCFEQPLLS